MALNRKRGLSFFLAACAALSLLSGCGGVPVAKTGQRGLLQHSGSYVISDNRPGAIAPNPLASDFIWPVREGSISSPFGYRKKPKKKRVTAFHEGIDIKANRGTPIYAVREGVVIYSSRRIKGYGNMIVIKHDGEFATVYAHNRKNIVKKGDRVARGTIIGYVGSTGKTTGPHLHFEIRKGEMAQDPLQYLPLARAPAVAENEAIRRIN